MLQQFAESVARGIGWIELLPLILQIIPLFTNICGKKATAESLKKMAEDNYRPQRRGRRNRDPYTPRAMRFATDRVRYTAEQRGEHIDEDVIEEMGIEFLDQCRTSPVENLRKMLAEVEADTKTDDLVRGYANYVNGEMAV